MKALLKYIFKEFFGFIFRILRIHSLIGLLNRRSSVYFVFNYHSFSKYNNYRIRRGNLLETGYKENFERQIKFFNKHFLFSYPEEFFKVSTPEHSVLVTFDDGYKDNFDLAIPILEKYNAKAIFFIVTSLTGTNDMLMHDKIRLLVQQNKLPVDYLDIPIKINNGENKYFLEVMNKVNKLFVEQQITNRNLMNYKELQEIYTRGFKLGVHTHNHKPLVFIDVKDQNYEVKTCIDHLSTIDSSIIHIAYPNGLYDASVIKTCEDLELKYGFTTNRGFNTKAQNQMEIKRIGLNVSDSLNVVVLKLVLNYIKSF